MLKGSADLVLQLVHTIVGQTSITIHRPDTRASQCALVDVYFLIGFSFLNNATSYGSREGSCMVCKAFGMQWRGMH